MGKESRIRKYRKEFKELAGAVAKEQGCTIGDVAFNYASKGMTKGKTHLDPDKFQAIRWFTKEKNAERFFV